MQLGLQGHPIHTRALAVTISSGADRCWDVSSYILDLRKRGFVPVGSELQGMGIIHHMEILASIDAETHTLISLEPRQPTVAFEAGADTCGESCRDPIGRLQEMAGARLDASFNSALRQVFGGALGCSHLLALGQFLAATVTSALVDADPQWRDARPGQRLFRRDLIFDGHEIDEGKMAIAVQLADLSFQPKDEPALPMDRFGSQYELRMRVDLEGWPATILAISGGDRRRDRNDFSSAEWNSDEALSRLSGVSLGKGGSATIARELATLPQARDAMLMLGPALIQCRAAFPDKWLNQVAMVAGHPGLIAMLDSCYMWRRAGGLERTREDLLRQQS